MTPHEAHHISHPATPVCSAHCLIYVGAAGKTSQRDSSQLRHIAGFAGRALVHIAEFARVDSATLLASALRSTFGSLGARPEPFENSASASSSQPTFLGDVPCTEPYRKARPKPAKSPDTLVGRPTDLSETTFSPTSQSLSSGEKTPLRISRRRAAAACAKPSAFSAVIASGRAMRSPPSCRKFSSVRECGT
jgi:hypothetical protein